jgi:hypothetical protein
VADSMQAGSLVVWRGASLIEVRLSAGAARGRREREVPKREAVKEFSGASRHRLLELLGQVDRQAVPFFVTLTYPDSFPADSGKFKGHLDTFCQRVLRRWPGAAVAWKLEFQERKSGENVGKVAPHFHLFLWNVPWVFPFRAGKNRDCSLECLPGPMAWECDGYMRREVRQEMWVERAWGADGCEERSGHVVSALSPCEEEIWNRDGDGLVRTENGDSILGWVSRNWYSVVGSRDLRHFMAGTRVEKLRSMKGAIAYASKYVCGQGGRTGL